MTARILLSPFVLDSLIFSDRGFWHHLSWCWRSFIIKGRTFCLLRTIVSHDVRRIIPADLPPRPEATGISPWRAPFFAKVQDQSRLLVRPQWSSSLPFWMVPDPFRPKPHYPAAPIGDLTFMFGTPFSAVLRISLPPYQIQRRRSLAAEVFTALFHRSTNK